MQRRPTVLRLIRVAAGLPLCELAEVVRIDVPRLSRLERGQLEPTEWEARAILRALGSEAVEALREALAFLDAETMGDEV